MSEPIEKTTTRNMFYDEQWKHVRTKKEILDESGNIRKDCRIVKKGEVYERNLLHVFDENGLYLATKKIGKNNLKAEQIQTDNVCVGIVKLTG